MRPLRFVVRLGCTIVAIPLVAADLLARFVLAVVAPEPDSTQPVAVGSTAASPMDLPRKKRARDPRVGDAAAVTGDVVHESPLEDLRRVVN